MAGQGRETSREGRADPDPETGRAGDADSIDSIRQHQTSRSRDDIGLELGGISLLGGERDLCCSESNLLCSQDNLGSTVAGGKVGLFGSIVYRLIQSRLLSLYLCNEIRRSIN